MLSYRLKGVVYPLSSPAEELLICVALFVAVKKNAFKYENVVCFNFTTLARNSPLSLAIAISAFPDRPLIALVLVIGPLIELPVLSLIAQLLLFLRRKGYWASEQ
jgi:ACR3 family arsenite efflux pump ArsB